MKNILNYSAIPKVKLHPQSVKAIKQGHPWVTADNFTEKFPKTPIIIGVDHNKSNIAILLHDYKHPKIKARVWKILDRHFAKEISILKELNIRFIEAVKKRGKIKDRDNYYLAFGEVDDIPGMKVLKLANTVLIIFESFFWEDVGGCLIKQIATTLKELDVSLERILVQTRDGCSSYKLYTASGNLSKNNISDSTIEEFGIKYSLNFSRQDFGIYTDMSSVREKLKPFLKKSGSILNLYSYTGAFSLLALKLGCKKVVSVDMSSKNQKWLQSNLDNNNELDPTNHLSLTKPVDKAIDSLTKENELFDFIVCDPPSSSNDGKKRVQALSNYVSLIPKLITLLNKNGRVLLFLNTHKVTEKRFSAKIDEILKKSKLNKVVRVERKYRLGDDASYNKVFSEGDYLKGILLRKV
jgi:23S rRNA (cytosine1962-C5)-methyltransferase